MTGSQYEKYGSTYLQYIMIKLKIFQDLITKKRTIEFQMWLLKLYRFSSFLVRIRPDIVIIHGDRIEALACAQAAVFNNIKVAHIEGGEIQFFR